MIIKQIYCFSTTKSTGLSRETKYFSHLSSIYFNSLHIRVSLDTLGQTAAERFDLLDQAGAVAHEVDVVDLDHAVLHPVLIVVVFVLCAHLEEGLNTLQ